MLSCQQWPTDTCVICYATPVSQEFRGMALANQ